MVDAGKAIEHSLNVTVAVLLEFCTEMPQPVSKDDILWSMGSNAAEGSRQLSHATSEDVMAPKSVLYWQMPTDRDVLFHCCRDGKIAG